jgi:hypothetical protein
LDCWWLRRFAVALVLAGTASASPPIAFSTTFTNVSAVTTSFRQADGNTFVSEIVQQVYVGDFAGTARNTSTW